MKKRRVPLSLAILLPTLLALVVSMGVLYAAAYFVMRDTSIEASIRDDEADLDTVSHSFGEDDNYTVLGYGLTSLVLTYEENKPATLPEPGSQEEQDYQDLMAKASQLYLYSTVERRLERYITTFIGIFYEDAVKNRLVLLCSTDSRDVTPEGKPTSMYLGEFFTKPDYITGGEYYGVPRTDKYNGKVYSSGIRLEGIHHPTQPSGDYTVWIIRETSEELVFAQLPLFTRAFAIVAPIALLAVFVILILSLHFLVIKPTRRLSEKGNAYIKSLNDGEIPNLFQPTESKYTNELTDLNDSLFYTQEAIVQYSGRVRASAAYEEKIKADLALAERIQNTMVPSTALFGDNYLIRGFMWPAKEVGGDLYNYFPVDEDHVGFYIGDVSGKGVPAALFMAKANTLLRLVLKDFDINKANRVLCEDNVENFFVTAFLALLNTKTGELRYVNCGHEPVYHAHDGVFSKLDEEPNLMLGFLPDFDYKIQTIQLKRGDRIFLYTDGISEAMNVNGDLFGRDRILECLNKHADLPGGALLDAMVDEVSTFAGEAEQSDDACMVSLDYVAEKVLVFPATREGLAQVEPFADDFLKNTPPEFHSKIQVVLDELCSNVVFYSECGDEPIRLILRDSGFAIRATLIDKGKPFNPLTDKPPKEDPDAPGGLGIIMAQSMTDKIIYARVRNGNVLSFFKAYKKN